MKEYFKQFKKIIFFLFQMLEINSKRNINRSDLDLYSQIIKNKNIKLVR